MFNHFKLLCPAFRQNGTYNSVLFWLFKDKLPLLPLKHPMKKIDFLSAQKNRTEASWELLGVIFYLTSFPDRVAPKTLLAFEKQKGRNC